MANKRIVSTPGGFNHVPPSPIPLNRAPLGSDHGEIGQICVDKSGQNAYVAVANGATGTNWKTSSFFGASNAQALAETSSTVALVPSNLTALGATTTFAGLIETATTAKTNTGTDTASALTPSNIGPYVLSGGNTAWTPTISGATPPTSVTYTTQVGFAQRIGSIVFCHFTIVINAITLGPAAGELQILGMPYAQAAFAGSVGGGSIWMSGPALPASTIGCTFQASGSSSTQGRIMAYLDNAAVTQVLVTGLAAGDTIEGSFFYFTA